MKRKGFTLIEVLMAVALFSVLVAVVFSMYFVGTKTFSIAVDQSFIQKQARTAADFISKELRTAKAISIDPMSFSGEDCYILQLKDKNSESYLVKTTKQGGQQSDAFVVPLSEMTFSSSNSNMLNVYVKAGDIRMYEINFDVRLENISAVSIQQGSTVIYYSKY
jgi:prepilin-type N-terminal cleavage/methylation domain-containing protein